DLTNPECIAGAATRDCRVVYFETPVNPTMELIDMAAVRKVVDQLNASRPELEQIRIVVDNTFATPYCQRPLEFGVDLVVHSLTKEIGRASCRERVEISVGVICLIKNRDIRTSPTKSTI